MSDLTSPLGGDDLAKALRDAYGQGYAVGSAFEVSSHDLQSSARKRLQRDAWIAQYMARLPAAEQKGASFGPGCSASPSPSVSALSGEHPSRGWQPISSAPLTTDPILVSGWVFADDDWNSGYVGYWRDAPAHKAKERHYCIGYMVQPASGHRCVGHRNGPVNITHWMPLPPAPCDGSAEGGETGTGSTEGNSAVGVAEAPEATPKSSPDQTPVDPQMTVEEAREVLRGINKQRTPQQEIAKYRQASTAMTKPVNADRCLAKADRIELALRTLQAGGEVKDTSSQPEAWGAFS